MPGTGVIWDRREQIRGLRMKEMWGCLKWDYLRQMWDAWTSLGNDGE